MFYSSVEQCSEAAQPSSIKIQHVVLAYKNSPGVPRVEQTSIFFFFFNTAAVVATLHQRAVRSPGAACIAVSGAPHGHLPAHGVARQEELAVSPQATLQGMTERVGEHAAGIGGRGASVLLMPGLAKPTKAPSRRPRSAPSSGKVTPWTWP